MCEICANFQKLKELEKQNQSQDIGLVAKCPECNEPWDYCTCDSQVS